MACILTWNRQVRKRRFVFCGYSRLTADCNAFRWISIPSEASCLRLSKFWVVSTSGNRTIIDLRLGWNASSKVIGHSNIPTSVSLLNWPQLNSNWWKSNALIDGMPDRNANILEVLSGSWQHLNYSVCMSVHCLRKEGHSICLFYRLHYALSQQLRSSQEWWWLHNLECC